MTAKPAEEGKLEIIQAATWVPWRLGGDIQSPLTSKIKWTCWLDPKETGGSLTLTGTKQATHRVLPALHTPPLLVNTKVKGHQPWATSLSPLRLPCPGCLECPFSVASPA